MVKEVTFDVRYDNELAHDYYGEGEKLANNLRTIYHEQNLKIPSDFDSTLTVPPIHFIGVEAPDETDVEELRKVEVPPGLNIEIFDFHM